MPTENDPLLDLPRQTAAAVRKNKRKQRRAGCVVVTASIVGLALVFVGMIVVKRASNPSNAAPQTVLGRAIAAQSRVVFDDSTGVYSVDWNDSKPNAKSNANANGKDTAKEANGIIPSKNSHSHSVVTPSTTFSELAEIMLLPWYEASIMALIDDPAWTAPGGIDEYSIGPIRKVLLIARDMIDVFSPVFPNTPDAGAKPKKKLTKKGETRNKIVDQSLWKELRTMYRKGYQIAGELSDLRGIMYSQELFETRTTALLNWKRDFVAFQKAHRIRRYLYSDFATGLGGIDPAGCYFHRASHLFWADESADSLPHGFDSGTGSVKKLLSVQLEHSLEYLEVISNFTTVMPRENEVRFHNLRKELRIFVDVYELFESVLFQGNDSRPNTNDAEPAAAAAAELRANIDLLFTTQIRLGKINDAWTAHDIYAHEMNKSHPEKVSKLAKKTDRKWHEFLDWEIEHDLKGTIESVLERLQE